MPRSYIHELAEVAERIQVGLKVPYIEALRLGGRVLNDDELVEDPGHAALGRLAKARALRDGTDIVEATRAVYDDWRRTFTEPVDALRHMGPTPKSPASIAALQAQKADDDVSGLDFQSQVVIRRIGQLADQAGISYAAMVQRLVAQAAPAKPAPTAAVAPSSPPARTAPVAQVEPRAREVAENQDAVVDEWAQREGAERGVDGEQAKIDYAARRVAEVNARNAQRRSR